MAQTKNFFKEMKDALLLIETGDIIKLISIYEVTYGKINDFQIFYATVWLYIMLSN